MRKIKEIITDTFSFIIKLILNLLKAVGNWFLSIVMGIYGFFKAIILGIYYVIFKTTLKQKVSALFVIALLIGTFTLTRLKDLDYQALEKSDRIPEEGRLVDLNYQKLKDEEKYLTLYDKNDYLVKMDLTTTNIEILNKETGALYQTITSEGASKALKTPFTITYKLVESNATQTLNAMDKSVEEETYEVYEIENGVRVDYTIGNSSYSIKDLPSVIDPAKYQEKILDVISEESQALVNKYYKYSKNNRWNS